MFHLLAEGGSVVSTVSRLFGSDARPGSPALVDTGTIQILQFSLVALGLAASLYTAYRIAQRDPSPARRLTTLRPYAAVIVLLGGVNVYLFTLPMTMRM